jgi:hypothetical protein
LPLPGLGCRHCSLCALLALGALPRAGNAPMHS